MFLCDFLQGVGFLGILSWSILAGRKHKFYLSKCKEQSGLYSQCALADCLARMRAGQQRYTRLVVLVDSGRHYVCNSFMAYVLVHVGAQYTNLKEVSLAISPAGHGKGPVDAEFAVCRSFKKFLRRRFWVNEVETYVALMQQRADTLYEQCSLRPHREFIMWFPPPKAKAVLPSLDDSQLRKADMPVQSVFFWSSVLDQSRRRTIRAHQEHGGEVSRSIQPELVPSPVDLPEWESYYRNNDPCAPRNSAIKIIFNRSAHPTRPTLSESRILRV